MPEQRELDLVVLGATGFTGRLVAERLAAAAPDGLRIGLAGRSAERLARVREGLGHAAADWPLLLADLADPRSLEALARSTRVVATTAGPYAGRGLPLVEACVGAGTEYADLTGEVLFIRDSADRHHAAAAASGVRVVHACGVDSVPSDLAVLLLHGTAGASGAAELVHATALVTAFSGGFSGGTVATARAQLEEVRADARRRRIVADPYALSPDRGREPDLGDQRDRRFIEHDRELRRWLAPFAMAGINAGVVRRSNALKGWAYGRRFRYVEARAFPEGLRGCAAAAATAAGQGIAAAALGRKRLRPLLDRVVPAPGEGPDETTRRRGRFAMETHAQASDGRRFVARVAADGDPGYTLSAVLFAESALCLALDPRPAGADGGVLTPATALGAALVERLRAAGVVLGVTSGR